MDEIKALVLFQATYLDFSQTALPCGYYYTLVNIGHVPPRYRASYDKHQVGQVQRTYGPRKAGTQHQTV